MGRLPRTPAVFDRKVKHSVPEAGPSDVATWADNYSSVKERPEVVRQQFAEEAKEGFMVKMSLDEARA